MSLHNGQLYIVIPFQGKLTLEECGGACTDFYNVTVTKLPVILAGSCGMHTDSIYSNHTEPIIVGQISCKMTLAHTHTHAHTYISGPPIAV